MVAAYLLSTCYGPGDCESFICLALAGLNVSSLFQLTRSLRYLQESYTVAQVVPTTPLCANVAPLRFLSYAHVADVREQPGSRMVVILFATPGVYVSPISWSQYAFNCTNIMPPGT